MITVLFRDNNWIAVNKPAGLPTTAPDHADVKSLRDHVLDETKTTHCHPLSRLDVEVTGVVVFAITQRSVDLATLTKQRGEYRREYVAILSPAPSLDEGTWDAAIGTDPRDHKHRVANNGIDPKSSRSRFVVKQRSEHHALTQVALETGRTHQIRVHASFYGSPVVGDRAYGGTTRFVRDNGAVVVARRTLLHAVRVWIPSSNVAVHAPLPADFQQYWTSATQTPCLDHWVSVLP